MSLLLVAATAAGVALGTPMRTSPLDSLAEETARLTSRYTDRRTAIADGYRRIGSDFPSMGEHWLHAGVLIAQRVAAGRPTILTYASIDGTPTLLGVGFVVTTRGDSLAEGAPGWPDRWHEHSGLLSDESGAGTARGAPSTSETKVWVLHIWTALANPAGRYESDNWALPFLRAGLPVPTHLDADIGRALAFAVGGGDEFFRRVLTDAGLRHGSNTAAVDAAIARARTGAELAIADARSAATVSSPVDLSALRAVWSDFGASLRTVIGPSVEPFLAPPHPAKAGHAHP